MALRSRVLPLLLLLVALLGLGQPAQALLQEGAGEALENAAEAAAEAVEEVADAVEEAPEERGFMDELNDTWGTYVNGPIIAVFFFDVWFWDDPNTGIRLELAVVWLMFGAILFTIKMGFINLRGFKHAIDVTRGKYSDPNDKGEVSHFQALTAALSATVGLGNIAGVAIAISVGGPGATFWMILAGFLGMSSKFTECTLGQMYRRVRSDGSVMGGAMYYLSEGLKEQGKAGLGKFLAVFFAILCIGGSFAGGNRAARSGPRYPQRGPDRAA